MPFELPPNAFRSRLAKGDKLIGCWITLASTTAAEIVAEAGFDWVLIDMEHAPNEIEGVMNQARATLRSDAEPVVRVPVLDPTIVKRLLDGGIRSLMFPNIRTVDEARLAVAATRFPPHGIRGIAVTTRGGGYGRLPDYLTTAANDICVILQLESRQALEATAEIGAVEGVDALFIGPNDLAAEAGLIGQTGAPEIQRLMQGGLAQIQATGCAPGTLNFDHAQAMDLFRDGYGFIAVTGDGSLLARHSSAVVASYRDALTSELSGRQ